tara:strand:+ start:1236 stop:2744 length:1509 start_codon:yes stop_codon:yes gene_type:complete
MAGQSQAANLGGMLSQIGNTLGTSVDSENYVRGTQNMFRPDVEADDIEGQRQLMNWQTKLGRTDEARNTLLGINTLEEKQKEEKAKREGQARAAGVAEYQKALKGVDVEAIASAEDALYKLGEVQGIDVTNLLAGVEQRAYAASDQEYQEKERLRLADERALEAKEKKDNDALAVAFGQANTIEEADAFLKGAPASSAILAQQLYNSAETRITNGITRDREEAQMKAPMQNVSITFPKGLSTDLQGKFKQEREKLDKDIDALNQKIERGEILYGSEGRQTLLARRRSLEDRVAAEGDRLIVARDEERRKAEKETAKQIRDLEKLKRAPLSNTGVDSLAKAIAGVDKKGKPNPVTTEHIVAARAQLREIRNNDYDKGIEYLKNPEGDEEGVIDLGWPELDTVVDGMRYEGGDPQDPANWQPVGGTIPESPQASAVNSDGYVTGRSGGQNKGVIGQRAGQSLEALAGSAMRGLETVAGAYSAITPEAVPMSENPAYYGNYQQPK